MERKHTASMPLTIAPTACLHLSLLCLLLPLQWLAAFVISTMIHEACHLVALKLCRVPILSLNIRSLGMEICTPPLLPGQELVCAFAGPLGSAGLILTAKWMPLTALCGLFHLLYNLLPVYPADGGRILKSCLEMFFSSHTVQSCCRFAELVVVCAAMLVALYAFLILRIGLLPLGVAALLLCRGRCK